MSSSEVGRNGLNLLTDAVLIAIAVVIADNQSSSIADELLHELGVPA